jgi:hypothetical protein
MSTGPIAVTSLGNARWRVDVRGETTTAHEVTIPAGYLARLGIAGVPPERVLAASFRFLLEREPNTSILRTFALPVITQYFSEYEDEIAKRVSAGGL